MLLAQVEIQNFRGLESISLDLDGETRLVVGANAIGKSTVLESIWLALKGGSVSREDFFDAKLPLSVIATITGVPAAQHGVFANALDFSIQPPVLRVGVRATWDAAEREVEAVHGFPDDGWRKVSREAREQLPLIFLNADRDPRRLSQTVGRGSLLADLMAGLAIDSELAAAVKQLDLAAAGLSAATDIRTLLASLDAEIREILPGSGKGFELGAHTTEPGDVLRRFELLLSAGGPAAVVGEQSSGLAQAAIFALALTGMQRQAGAIILVDEPEQRLHPQAQRALVARIEGSGHQAVLTTHSSSVLDRVDPRRIARLRHDGSRVVVSRAKALSDADAERLRRYSTSQTAEAFFAKAVILVEGFSDLLALRAIAQLVNVNLDASGVSLLSIEGKESFKHYVDLFGPTGLAVELRGLCDADAEVDWRQRLTGAGVPVSDRGSFNAAGFQVCDPDLEAEMCRALGEAAVEHAISTEGGQALLNTFRNQPANRGKQNDELLEAFVRKDKIRWAPVLGQALPPASIPRPIHELLTGV